MASPLKRAVVKHLTRNVCASCVRRHASILLKSRTMTASYDQGPPILTLTTPPMRQLHTSSKRPAGQYNPEEQQAQPPGDFYTDLLSKPIPKSSHAKSSLPTFVKSGNETKEERARKLFGDIQGSGYERRTPTTPDETWRTINGVAVPPRPAEPENCCMSGCVHCVWDDYRDDIEQWAARVADAQAKSHGDNVLSAAASKAHTQRDEVDSASASMDDDGGGSEALWDAPSAAGTFGQDDLFKGIPIGIREFMATEKRIRERKRRKEKGSK